MNTIDVTQALKSYSQGWVAIDKKSKKVVAHAKTFASISKKVKGIEDIFLMPASKKYFGFVTANA